MLSQAAAALQSRALVYVYSCNLSAAIQVGLLLMHSHARHCCHCYVLVLYFSDLSACNVQVEEESMQSDLINYVSEPLLQSLSTMFELVDSTGNDGADGKTRLLTLIGGILPDDFDARFLQPK